MKDKLKLEELAAYYPSDINAIDNDGIFCKISTLFENCVGVEYEMNVGEYEKEFNEIELVLHPLSDLTKEIEVNGEKFVPIERLLKIYSKTINHLSDEYKEKAIESFRNGIITQELPYKYIITLISCHFDIFGLIDRGLAIDINTLNQPIK